MTPSDPIDRRTFLSRGAATGGVVALGATAPALLAACASGSSTGGGGKPTAPFFSQGSAGIGHGSPKRGGSVTIGTTAEIDGFYPPNNHWDNNGFLYANTIYDPLTAAASDGTIHPYLAESVTPNADSSVWTVTLRPNTRFHDGTALDANVLKNNYDALTRSLLTGLALRFISSVDVTGPLSVAFTFDQPVVSFAAALATQVGYVVAQSMIDAAKANPSAAPYPVGTGPFVYSKWEPNSHFTATRNLHYWRPGLPYLDSITYRPIPDTAQREATLRTGAVDLILSIDAKTLHRFEGSGFSIIDSLMFDVGEPDMDFIMLNCESPPTDDLRVRQALAKGMDQARVQSIFGGGVVQPATGLFPKGSKYYSTTSYPGFDPAGARALVASYKKDHGTAAFALTTVPDPRLLNLVQVLQQMWNQVGFDVTVSSVQQAELIANAIYGKFQAYTFEMFSTPDPDLNYVWWSTTTVAPDGELALNFARNSDPQVEAALIRGRHSASQSARIEAYQTVNERLSLDLPYLWLGQTVWSEVADARIQNFANPILPDGAKGIPFDNGVFFPAHIWVAG